MRRTGRRVGPAALALIVLAGVLITGCRVEVDVLLDVESGGSGTVEVAVGLDDEAVDRIGNLEENLQTGDLAERGWTISPPTEEGDLTWVRARKAFQSPHEAEAILREVSGEGGPFRDFRVERDRSFLQTRYGFDGTVDLTPGIEAFGDDALARRLGGRPLGHDIEEIQQLARATLDRVFRFRVGVRLPGDVDSNAPAATEGGAVWRPSLGERAELRAASEAWNGTTIAWSVVAVLAAGALAAMVVGRVTRAGRHRSTRQASGTTR